MVSLGDFVLSGGEIPALALIDACVRLIPGVLGSEQTLEEEKETDAKLTELAQAINVAAENEDVSEDEGVKKSRSTTRKKSAA